MTLCRTMLRRVQCRRWFAAWLCALIGVRTQDRTGDARTKSVCEAEKRPAIGRQVARLHGIAASAYPTPAPGQMRAVDLALLREGEETHAHTRTRAETHANTHLYHTHRAVKSRRHDLVVVELEPSHGIQVVPHLAYLVSGVGYAGESASAGRKHADLRARGHAETDTRRDSGSLEHNPNPQPTPHNPRYGYGANVALAAWR